MKCPQCGATSFRTKSTQNVTEQNCFRRRRQCTECGYTFTTYEEPMTPQEYKAKKWSADMLSEAVVV